MKHHNLPYGLSIESTYENATECFGGAHPLTQQ